MIGNRIININASNLDLVGKCRSGAFNVVKCDASTESITIYIPDAASGSRLKMILIKTDSSANTVTLNGTSGQKINGSDTLVLSSQYDSAYLVSDLSNWFKIN